MPRFNVLYGNMRRTAGFLAPWLIGLFLGGLYLYTMAPGLTWANDGADGGDLVTAAVTGGVPHPSGYPTYLLLASAFLKIPIGSLAYRTNLLSCFCTIATALIIYKIMRSVRQGVFSASVASLAYGTFQLVWSQAIITEVNALNGLFAALLLYFFVLEKPTPLTDVLGGLAAGIALGNHLTIIFILPLMCIDKSPPKDAILNNGSNKESIFSHVRFFARRLAGLLIGLCVYLIIPLRAGTMSPVNWGNAINLDGLTWLVSGKMYWGRLDYLTGNYLLAGVQNWSLFLFWQLGIFGLLLIIIVLAVHYHNSRIYSASVWLIVIYSVFSVVYYSPDSYVYLIPVLISLSIWMGLASQWIADRISSRSHNLELLSMIGILGFIIIRAIVRIPDMNLSNDQKVEIFSQGILNSAPAHAVIFTEGDETTFSLWYYLYANHERPDISIVSADLLDQTWYRAVLRYTYPDLVIGEDAAVEGIIRDNPRRPICSLLSEQKILDMCVIK